MPELSSSINRAIASIGAGRTAVFCGAGISLHSGIPLVGQLVPRLLEKLGVSRQAVLGSDGRLKIPFETLMEVLVHASDAGRLLDIFGTEDEACDALEPDFNHMVLGGLVRAGRLKRSSRRISTL